MSGFWDVGRLIRRMTAPVAASPPAKKIILSMPDLGIGQEGHMDRSGLLGLPPSYMTADDDKVQKVEEMLATPNLADALESEQFRHFLDQIPIAIIVSEMKSAERIVYANPEFEKLSGQAAAELAGKPWTVLRGEGNGAGTEGKLGAAI